MMSEHSGHGMMGSRGVTRPMAEQGMQQGDDHDHGGGHDMSREDRLSMLQMHHKQTLWIYWTYGAWDRYVR